VQPAKKIKLKWNQKDKGEYQSYWYWLTHSWREPKKPNYLFAVQRLIIQ